MTDFTPKQSAYKSASTSENAEFQELVEAWNAAIPEARQRFAKKYAPNLLPFVNEMIIA